LHLKILNYPNKGSLAPENFKLFKKVALHLKILNYPKKGSLASENYIISSYILVNHHLLVAMGAKHCCTLTEVFLTLTEVFPCFYLSCKANSRI
jgi:hypothetical protein